MASQQNQRVIFVCAAAVVMLVGISNQNRTQASDHKGTRVGTECPIDISPNAPQQQCTLSKAHDDRVIWENNSDVDIYACADPKKDPFDAYGWYVPRHEKRKSGKIRDAITPPQSYDNKEFYTYSTPCLASPPTEGTRSNPKIIIQ